MKTIFQLTSGRFELFSDVSGGFGLYYMYSKYQVVAVSFGVIRVSSGCLDCFGLFWVVSFWLLQFLSRVFSGGFSFLLLLKNSDSFGIIIIAPGFTGCYWSRPLRFRWFIKFGFTYIDFQEFEAVVTQRETRYARQIIQNERCAHILLLFDFGCCKFTRWFFATLKYWLINVPHFSL